MIKLIKILLVAAGTVIINLVILSILYTIASHCCIYALIMYFGLFQLLISVPLAIVVRRRSHIDKMVRFWGILLGSIMIALLNALLWLSLSTNGLGSCRQILIIGKLS